MIISVVDIDDQGLKLAFLYFRVANKMNIPSATNNMKVQITKRKLCDKKVEASLLIHRIDTV